MPPPFKSPVELRKHLLKVIEICCQSPLRAIRAHAQRSFMLPANEHAAHAGRRQTLLLSAATLPSAAALSAATELP